MEKINNLYKEGKINSDKKISFKQLIISDSNKIIEKYINFYKKNNDSLDEIITSQKIQKFINLYIKNL